MCNKNSNVLNDALSGEAQNVGVVVCFGDRLSEIHNTPDEVYIDSIEFLRNISFHFSLSRWVVVHIIRGKTDENHRKQ